MTIAVSRITRAGQITLPKQVRSRAAFAGAKAVAFEDRGVEVVIVPLEVKKQPHHPDHASVLDRTMREWSKEEHDDLFKLPSV